MSRRNGQRARFQINRKRRILKRVRTRALAGRLKANDGATPSSTPKA